jgi:hypothetical protein
MRRLAAVAVVVGLNLSCDHDRFYFDEDFIIDPELTKACCDLSVTARSRDQRTLLLTWIRDSGVVEDVCFHGEALANEYFLDEHRDVEIYLVFRETGVHNWSPGIDCDPPCSVFAAVEGTAHVVVDTVEGYDSESYYDWKDGGAACAEVDLTLTGATFQDTHEAGYSLNRENLTAAQAAPISSATY